MEGTPQQDEVEPMDNGIGGTTTPVQESEIQEAQGEEDTDSESEVTDLENMDWASEGGSGHGGAPPPKVQRRWGPDLNTFFNPDSPGICLPRVARRLQ